MRLALLLCVGCGFSPTSGGALVDQGVAGFDGELDGGSVASRGAIEPETYYVGGLHAKGYHAVGVTRTTTAADLAALFTQPPTGAIVGQTFTAWGSDPANGWPHGLGIAAADNFSVVVDGEIWLPAGTTTYVFAADDAGFVEVTIDGAITSAHADFTANGTMSLVTTRAGWYAIRGAMSETSGSATFQLVDNTNAPANTVASSRLRSKTTDQRGLVGYVFALEEIEFLAGLWLDGPIDHDGFRAGDYPYSVFSLRYAGQLLIDAADTYTITASVGAADHFRIWIDGELVASHWLTMTDLVTPVALTAGWHSITFDDGNNAAGSVHLQSNGTAVPLDHLRPAVAWGVPRPVSGNGQAVAWNDSTPAVYTMVTFGNDGEVLDTVDIGYGLAGTRTGITLTLDQGGPTDTLPVHAMPNEVDGTAYDYEGLRTAFVGTPLVANWHFTVANTPADGMTGACTASVMASIHGGPNQPFAPVVTYTSSPHATPGARTIDRVMVDAQLGTATVTLALRASHDAATLAQQPWLPIDRDVELDLAGDEFAQYQIVLTGDGWTFPSVDRVELDYEQ